MTMLPNATLDSLGERLRKARKERGLSQEKLAKPEFTKSYVSAVERGKARPSLKALSLMAGRLGLDMHDLLQVLPAAGMPDPAALEADLHADLDTALLLMHQAQAPAALTHLNR